MESQAFQPEIDISQHLMKLTVLEIEAYIHRPSHEICSTSAVDYGVMFCGFNN